MRMSSTAALLLSAIFLPVVAFGAEPVRQVPLRVEPPQAMTAIVLRSGDQVLSVPVSMGRAVVPREFAFPWTLGLTAFEPVTYTQADLDAGRPLLVRQLGGIRGTLRRPVRTRGETFTWLLQLADSDVPRDLPFTVADDERFTIAVPAGVYEGAVVGAQSGSRIRSGIVVQPGKVTDLGEMVIEPAVAVTLRVVDAKRGNAVPGARVTWSPPGDKLNADVSRGLYGRRWSSVTDKNGLATIAAVGPIPLSVGWTIQADGYASTNTAQMQLTEAKRMMLPDTRIRLAAVVIARVALAEDADALRRSVLVLGEIEGPRSLAYVRRKSMPLREGESRFTVDSYGKKRLWVEDVAGKRILYRDFEVTAETTVVDLAPHRVHIHGRVARKDQGIEGVLVTLADPVDARVVLARVKTDSAGEFALTTFQDGELYLYTISGSGPGKRSGAATQRVDVAGRRDVRVDLDLPSSGFVLTVLDAKTGAPLDATIKTRLKRATGGMVQGTSSTDAQGKLTVTGYPEGTATLHVQAKGYTSQEVEIPIAENNPDKTVRLERSGSVSGRVVTTQGTPIRGARVTGGYGSEMEMQAYFATTTGADGRFALDSAPPPGTTFYVAASGHALGITTLAPGRESVVTLSPPSAGIVTLRPDHAPPTKVYMVMAAPAGDDFIPLGVIDDLAEVNGLSPYQLNGTALDGSLVLPEFLGPGTYHLYLALRGGTPFIYDRVGTITTPLAGNAAIVFKAR